MWSNRAFAFCQLLALGILLLLPLLHVRPLSYLPLVLRAIR